MFNKLCKLHISQCFGLYTAACAAVFLGMSILALTLDGSTPIPLFHFAPSIVFLTAGMFAWVKVQDMLMGKGLRNPEATLLMTIPFTEKDIVLSKIVVGSIGNFVVYFVLCGMTIYSICFSQSTEYLFTILSAMYIDLSYDTMTAALSIGLVPIVVLLEQIAGCALLLWFTLLSTGNKRMIRIMPVIYFLFSVLQVGLNFLLLMKYQVMITYIHPLLFALGLLAVFVGVTFALYKGSVNYLRYKLQLS